MSWSRRFTAALESLGLGTGLDRGRRDAKAGLVLSLSLSTSVVVGQVQGHRENAAESTYRARIGVKALDAAEWDLVEVALAESALFSAKILAGELPLEIEAVFEELGLRLFPNTLRELSMDCSCPDWQVPCRHLAAVCQLLAESFDTDPFRILAWRGRDRQQLLTGLRTRREGAEEAHEDTPDGAKALANSLDTFWAMQTQPLPSSPLATGRPDELLDQLGPLPITVRRHGLVDLLRPAYRVFVRREEN
ncbi:MAG: family helicase [Amycolatopsis sp.]|uniref:SWIM zinc finger family protein n=1 Tax=Amycolatopsis sp. TaxID=37632 RepID=UPI00261E569D|nr:SWIM zinc finger family protein [Amycolatopsis sp.]MCU1679750.1 family helicase [Amycolatopsis sp.]